jgi:hypothetical protein
MIYTGQKYQGKIPLNYQYTLKINEGQEVKEAFFWGWVSVGDGRAQGKGKSGWLWWMDFVSIHENRRMKSVVIILRSGRGRRMMEEVNLTNIYCKHIGKYHSVPPVQLFYAKKNFKNTFIHWGYLRCLQALVSWIQFLKMIVYRFSCGQKFPFF